MTESRTNTVKPLVNNALIRGHLLAVAERLSATENEHAALVVDAINIVLDASQGVSLR